MPRNSNARMVAKKVIEQIKDGKRPNIKEASLAVGYSKHTARTQQKRIRENKAYVEEMFDFEKALDDQIQASIKDLKKKQSKASFRDNAEVVDKLTKLKRLVSGQSTENTAVTISGLLDNLENDGAVSDETDGQ